MDNSLPKISVVTITWGHEKFIEKTMNGVFMQKYDGPIEFIISNDNSPDQTDEVVKNYLKNTDLPKNFEIKYACHVQNKGIMKNFIWALQQACGQFIAICDGDDYWTDSYKLQKQLDFLIQNKNIILTGHNIQIFDNKDGEILNDSFPFKNKRNISAELIYKRNYIPAVSILFRNQHPLPDWFLQCPIGDYPLILFLSQFGEIGFQFDVMADYRKFSGYHSSESKTKKHRMLVDALNITLSKIDLKERKFKLLVEEQILGLELELKKSLFSKFSLILEKDLPFISKMKNIALCVRRLR